MPDNNLEKQIFKTYLKMIENSEGSRMFNSLYVREKDTNKEFDVYEDGVWSGAFYVSSILSIMNLLDRPHSTTDTIISVFNNKKEKDWGWRGIEIDNLKSGDVIIWEELDFQDGTKSDQIGFYIDENTAYSVSSAKRKVAKHHSTFGENNDGSPVRKIVAAYRNQLLN